MSRVFLARDAALRRSIVVKILAPDLASGLSTERFRREVVFAAGLQHPNVVPVLTAGTVDELPYFTMPYVEGQSLRARLDAPMPLGLDEAIRIMQDVARGLAHAHERGLVHCDVKPENVLLSDGMAMITDFGIARAIAHAYAGPESERLTWTGVVLGTPAYMAPEQAAGSGALDARSDLYAFGVMSYELLTGETPFARTSAQALLAAHLTETPAPISTRRADLPASLAGLVDQCLLKQPDERPATARAVLAALDELHPVTGERAEAERVARHGAELRRALVLYLVAFSVVSITAWSALRLLEVPDWVLPGALVLMALGLPMLAIRSASAIVVSRAHARPAQQVAGADGQRTPRALRFARLVHRRLTWRRIALAGFGALGLFAVAVLGFVKLRDSGIGPAGSLLGAGAIDARQPLLVTDFVGTGADSMWGPALSTAVRVSLGESPVLSVVPPAAIAGALDRLRLDRRTRIDEEVGLSIARRDGIPAVVDGSVKRMDDGYLLVLRLLESDSARVLATVSAVAATDDELLEEIDRLTLRLRERIGESYRQLRAASPLPQVTTPDLHALRLYEAGARANDIEQDQPRAIALLEEAVRIDTAFASAWRKLAVAIGNSGRRGFGETMRIAYRHRARATPLERAQIEVGYHQARGDRENIIRAYRSLTVLTDSTITTNHGDVLVAMGEYREAVQVLEAMMRRGTGTAITLSNLVEAQMGLGDVAAAESVLVEMSRRFPANQRIPALRLRLAYHALEFPEFRRALDSASRAGTPSHRNVVLRLQILTALLRGRPREAERILVARSQLEGGSGVPANALGDSAFLARIDAEVIGDPKAGVARLERALRVHPPESIPEPGARAYGHQLIVVALTGDAARARALVEARRRAFADTTERARDVLWEHVLEGWAALAAGEYARAAREFSAGQINCRPCLANLMATTHDLAGERDSTIHWLREVVTAPDHRRDEPANDGLVLSRSLERLSMLLEERGDSAEAARHLRRLLSLWDDPEPAVAGRAAAARRRLDRLEARRGG